MAESNEIMDDPYEDCPSLPARDLLKRLGYEPLPPGEVDDAQLTGRLWEFVYTLAGRRFYLHSTDHLSDREFYIWLHDRWLATEVSDIPYEAEWNCLISPGQEDGPEVYLRFYASPEEREQWLEDFPNEPIPAPEKTPYDRDRWMPEPPFPSAAEFQAEEFIMEDDEEEDEDAENSKPASLSIFPQDHEDEDDDSDDRAELASDPLGLAAVDREIRAQQEITDAEEEEDDDEFDDPAMAENWERPRDVLRRDGVRMLPPDELTDESVPAHLWELLHNLACRGFYLQHTDHLTDRELYSEIWEHGLTDLSLLPGKSQTGGWFHDVLGSAGPDDRTVYLSYYASEEERREHATEFPEQELPPRKAPVAQRDWRLPKGPF